MYKTAPPPPAAFVLLSLFIFVQLFLAASSSEDARNCSRHASCGSCISADCVWCGQSLFNATSRCSGSRLEQRSAGCVEELIFEPKQSIHYHNNITPRSGEGDDDVIQLAPQNITVRVTPNKPYTFTAHFRQAENYPVDVYFLMDVSFTMETFRQTLVNMTDALATALRNITLNYRLGVGAYVDKTVTPFSNARLDYGPNVDPTYSFRNVLSLTKNVTDFRRSVNGTRISANVDVPEGVFDALVQAMVCGTKIGWRDQSRKMIVVSTDGEFHLAGDGLLGGIIEPNDGRCHLDERGEYTMSSLLDYPSIGELAALVDDKMVNVIFAIPNNKTNVAAAYTQLSRHIEGSNVGNLTDDCSNVVELIQSNYEKISSSVQLKAETTDPDVRVSFRSRCLGGGEVQDTSTCEGLKMGDKVTFDVTVEVRLPNGCPADREQWTRSVVIQPAGLSEKLLVKVELDCECPCEMASAGVPHSPDCSRHGTFQCGVCGSCDVGFYGERCECSDDPEVCRNADTREVCSGRGRCVCGRCECEAISGSEPDRLFTGRSCECNDYACEYYNKQLCGGPQHGRCECGQCNCTSSWKGARCDCSKDIDQCLARNGKICNGFGTCECNECRCDDVYKGPTCEDCPTCTSGKCDQYAGCIRCQFPQQDPSACRSTFCPAVTMTDNVDEQTSDWPSNITAMCQARVDDYCAARFVYNYATGALRVQRVQICRPRPADITPLVIGVVVSILVVGLVLLLIWKAYVTVHDQREFARFEDDCKNARSMMVGNPIYKDAVTKYQNPTYDRGSHDKLA